jgi:hypothetical protein
MRFIVDSFLGQAASLGPPDCGDNMIAAASGSDAGHASGDLVATRHPHAPCRYTLPPDPIQEHA